MLTSLRTVFAADAHLSEGQFLREELTANRKVLQFLIATRIPTVSIKEGQHLKSI